MNIAERGMIRAGERGLQAVVGRYNIMFTGGDNIRKLKLDHEDQKYMQVQLAFCPHQSHGDERVVFEVVRRILPDIADHMIIPGKTTYWFNNQKIDVLEAFKNPKSVLKKMSYNFMVKYVPDMAFPGCEKVPIGTMNDLFYDLIDVMRGNVRTVVLIAPEGTRSLDKPIHSRKFFSGTPRLSIQTGSPIIPVFLIGMEKIFPKGSLIPRGLLRRTKLKAHVRFGEPIYPADYNNNQRSIKQALMEQYLQMGLSE